MQIPSFLRQIPHELSLMNAPADASAVELSLQRRKPFLVAGEPAPYMTDIVRAFRAAQGAKVYIEVGSRDKGNIAWLLPILAPDAVIIDIDIDGYPEQESRLRALLGPSQEYHSITGDCLSDAVLNRVKSILGARKADLVFCDTLHTYQHVLYEYEAYIQFVRAHGLLMFHDCYFEGTDRQKGKAHALVEIDKFKPVYAVFANEPVHRFHLRETNDQVWGGCGIVVNS